MKNIAMLFLVFSTFLIFTNLAYASTRTLTVEGKQKINIPLELKEDDRFSGKIVVSGNLDIDFYIADPSGAVFTNYTKTSIEELEFTAHMNGQYTFYFDNSDSDQTKTVTFNYNVQHYIFGIPQELFLVGVIIAVIMICLIVFVGLSQKP